MSRVTVKQGAKKATRTQVRAAIGIDGLSGSGKSGLALFIAKYLANKAWEKVYATDAENNSLSLYVGENLHDKEKVGEFWHAKLDKATGYSPFNYEYYADEAYEKGCLARVQDSYTHMWQREGGVLDMVNKIQAQGDKRYNDSYRAWGHPDTVDAKNLIFDLIRDNRMHVISTIRIKDKTVMEQGENGRTVIKKMGDKQMQSEGLIYEFDLMLRTIRAGDKDGTPPRVYVEKSRYSIFKVGEEYDITPEVMDTLKSYLEEGIDIDELNEKTRIEMAESLRERAIADSDLKVLLKKKYPDTKLAEMDLETLREVNSMFIDIEYSRKH